MDSAHSLPRPGIENRRLRNSSADVSACEPFGVFAVKSLLYPTIPVLTLLLCVLLWNEPLRGPYFLMAVLVFLGVADLIDVMPARILSGAALAVRSLIDITLRWALLMVFIYVLFKLSDIGYYLNKPMLWTWALTAPLALWTGELLAQRALNRTVIDPRQTRKAIIVGVTNSGVQLNGALAACPTLQVEVLGYFEDRAAARLPDQCAEQVLGSTQDVRDFIRRNHTDIVYIALPMTPHPRIVELMNSLRDSTASIYFVPDFTAFELMQPRFDLVEGIPVIAVCDSPFYGLRSVAKRLSDLLIAGAAMILLAPVFLAVAVGVRLSSPGPILYKQKRYGLDGRQIVVYKFRSLSVVEDGEHSYTQVVQNDSRVTPFGAFIRRTSLDELPQLFNIIKGDMSIVGPRPHAVAVNENYRRQIPGYMVRHKIKPGITGWAQVNGYRGGDDLDSMRARIACDLEYLRHWSLGLDLIIMFKTALMIWNDRHAY